MNEYTQNMRTVCVGRYLIDVPSQLEFKIANQKVNGIEIERLPQEVTGKDYFSHMMNVTERKLRDELAKLEFSGVDRVLPMGEHGRAFVSFRQSRKKRVVEIEAYFLKDHVIFKLKDGTLTEKTDEALEAFSALAARLSVHDNAKPLTSPGLCIDGGFITGKGFDQEEVMADFEERGNPGFGLSLSTAFAPGLVDENYESRIDRMDKQKTRAMFKEALANIKTKRKAPITLGGSPGKEWIYTDDLEGVKDLTAMADTPGGGTHQLQRLELNMTNGPKTKADPTSTKLSDETAISVWDAVIKTIRLRPSAL